MTFCGSQWNSILQQAQCSDAVWCIIAIYHVTSLLSYCHHLFSNRNRWTRLISIPNSIQVFDYSIPIIADDDRASPNSSHGTHLRSHCISKHNHIVRILQCQKYVTKRCSWECPQNFIDLIVRILQYQTYVTKKCSWECLQNFINIQNNKYFYFTSFYENTMNSFYVVFYMTFSINRSVHFWGRLLIIICWTE